MRAFIAGYASLGLLIGVLAGLTSSPVSNILIATLFAFAGGTATYLVDRGKADRRATGGILCAFSVLCLVGLVGAIVVKENRWLTFTSVAPKPPTDQPENKADSKSVVAPRDYLRSQTIGELKAIDQRFRAEGKKPENAAKAYDELWAKVDRIIAAAEHK